LRNFALPDSEINLKSGGEKVIDSYEKALIVARACLEKKAENIRVLDIRKVSNLADFFVICSGSSPRRTAAIREDIEGRLSLRNCKVWHREGVGQDTWMVLDYGDVIAHIFYEPMRKLYDLDRLWGDAQLVNF